MPSWPRPRSNHELRDFFDDSLISAPHYRRAAAFDLATALMSSVGQSFFIGLFGTSIRADLMLGLFCLRLGGQGLTGHLAGRALG